MMRLALRSLVVALLSLAAFGAAAQDTPDFSAYREQAVSLKYPQPTEKDFIIKNFQFHSGVVVPELKIHYTMLGNRAGPKVLILHGGGGSGTNYMSDQFAAQLFGPGQVLDARRYFIILPDSIGAGKSSKAPPGGFVPGDVVAAQYKLVTEELGIKHLRMVLGNSMGGRQAWIWGAQYPDMMDALVPMATSPGAWVPEGATVATAPAQSTDSAAPALENIKAYVLAVNSADDANNPPEKARLDRATARIPNAKFYIIPKVPNTIGHQTTSLARFWAKQVGAFLETVPKAPD